MFNVSLGDVRYVWNVSTQSTHLFYTNRIGT